MRRRAFLTGGAVVLLVWVAAGLVTLPDVGAGIWVDYVVPPFVAVLAVLALRPPTPAVTEERLGLAARLVVGGIWIWAGLLKLPDPGGSVEAVRAYDLLPQALIEPVGYLLPVLEVVLGVALVVGAMTRGAAFLSALLLVAFVVGIASAWARGLEISCGCFGDGGPSADATSQYPWEISRDVALLALSVALVAVRRTGLALDSFLFRPRLTLDDFLDEHHSPTEGTSA